MKVTQYFLSFAWASLCSALPVADFFEQPQHKARSVGYCTYDSNFDTSQFAGIALVGNTDGAPSFCETEWMKGNKPIQQLNIWWTPSRLQGIQAIYTDSTTSPVYGSTDAPSYAVIGVNYGAGDRWKQWTAWYEHNGDGRVSAFVVAASNGQKIHAGQTDEQITSKGLDGLDQYVGQGILMGFEGQSVDESNTGYEGGGVTRIGALFFVNGWSHIDVSNIQFPDGPVGSPVGDIESLAATHYYNGQTNDDASWTFMDSRQMTTTKTFTSTSTYTYGGMVQFSFSGDIGLFITVHTGNTDTFTWSTAQGSMNTNTETDQVTVSWGQSGTLHPGEGIDIQALIGHGKGSYGYTSTVTVTMSNGYTYNYQESGQLDIDDVSQAVISITQANHP